VYLIYFSSSINAMSTKVSLPLSTECRGRVVVNFGNNLGDSGVKFRPRDRLTWPKVIVYVRETSLHIRQTAAGDIAEGGHLSSHHL